MLNRPFAADNFSYVLPARGFMEKNSDGKKRRHIAKAVVIGEEHYGNFERFVQRLGASRPLSRASYKRLTSFVILLKVSVVWRSW